MNDGKLLNCYIRKIKVTEKIEISSVKELKENNVITKEGGIIGLGKTTKLSSDFNKEYFTKINIEKTTSINFNHFIYSNVISFQYSTSPKNPII